MSRIDEIKKRNERRNQLMNARKDEFNMLREVEYQRLVNDSVEDIDLLLAKLKQAELILRSIAGEEMPHGAKLIHSLEESARIAVQQIFED